MNPISFLNEMHLTPYSAAAYAIAWLVYLGYLAQILLRMKKVREEREELQRTTARNSGAATLKRSAG